MAGVEFVVAALAAGASEGPKDAAGGAVRDAYDRLCEAVRGRLADRGAGGEAGVLEAHDAEPDIWQTRLRATLSACDAGRDERILAAAQDVMRELGLPGRPDAAAVDVRDVPAGDRSMPSGPRADGPPAKPPTSPEGDAAGLGAGR